jgi:hypothetical protein
MICVILSPRRQELSFLKALVPLYPIAGF